MDTTIDLLDRAVHQAKSERALSRELGLASNSLSTARQRGRLSTAMSIVLARHIGEDWTKWALQAEEENERSAPLREKLAAIKQGLKSYFSTRVKTLLPPVLET